MRLKVSKPSSIRRRHIWIRWKEVDHKRQEGREELARLLSRQRPGSELIL